MFLNRFFHKVYVKESKKYEHLSHIIIALFPKYENELFYIEIKIKDKYFYFGLRNPVLLDIRKLVCC